MRLRPPAACFLAALAVSGCGLDVQSPDLFLLTRTGSGPKLTLLVNDSGTIRCNGGAARSLSDPLLLDARQLAGDLDQDVKNRLHFAGRAGVYTFSVHLQDGTLVFPDRAAAHHSELARAELFTLQAAQGPCRLAG
jgi:hypothetical protein